MQSFRYTLRGVEGTISVPLYLGANDYFASAAEANSSQEGLHLDIVNDYRQSMYLKNLVARIKSSATSPDDQARIAVSLVQHIPYDTVKAKKNDEGQWFNSYYPYEVLYNNKGKCDEKSHLLAFLLKELGFGTVIFEFHGERHSAVGIKSPAAYAFRNTGYAFVESTAPTIITDTNGQVGSLKIKDFSDPVVVKIADGTTMNSLAEEYADAKKMSETPGKIQYTSSGSSVSSSISSSFLSFSSRPFTTIRQQTYQPAYYTRYNPEYVALAEKYGIDYQTASGLGTSTSADIAGNQAKYTAMVLASEQMARKDYAGALVTINEVLTKKPDDTRLLVTKSGIQAIMGKYSESLSTLDAVQSRDPANPSAYYIRALVYQELKDYPAAVDACNAAIQIYPQYVNAMSSRGTLLAKQRKYDEALRSYDQALTINPDSAEAWTAKGDLLSSHGKRSEAMTAYKNALSAAPRLPKVWSALGALYAEEGRCGEAGTCYSRATSLDNTTRSSACISPLFYTLFGFGCLTGITTWGYVLYLFTKKK